MAAVIAWPMTLPIVIAVALVARILVPSRGGVLRRAGAFTFGPLIILAVLAVIAVLLPHNEAGPTLPEGGATGSQGRIRTRWSSGSADPGRARHHRRRARVRRPGLAAERGCDPATWPRAAPARPRPGCDRRRRGARPRRAASPALRRGRPGDAVAAFLAVLRTLEPDEELRRDPAETPAAHARRLRAAGTGTIELDLLAADFELARWGGRRSSPAEDRRAVGRWDRLRGRFGSRPADRVTTPETAGEPER